MIEFLGKAYPYNVEDVTPDICAKILEKEYPTVWRIVNTKHIESPGSHYGFKSLAVGLSCGILQGIGGRNCGNLGACTNILQKYDFPAYYVSNNLLSAMKHTHPPLQMKWSEVFFPYGCVVFMLPKGSVCEPSGKEVLWVGVCKLKAGERYKFPGTKFDIDVVNEDKIDVFWATSWGTVIQDCAFPARFSLEPEPGWIDKRTEEFQEITKFPEDGPKGDFASYMSGLVANFLLLMQARKELVESSQQKIRVLKSGLVSYSPNFIGRKYQIVSRTSVQEGTSKFTELGWRSGYIRRQHFGPKNSEEKLILIDPYIAFTKGLTKIDTDT